MANKIVIALFILFALLLLISSLLTPKKGSTAVPSPTPPNPVALPQTTAAPSFSPTTIPTPNTMLHPGYSVNVRGGDD